MKSWDFFMLDYPCGLCRRKNINKFLVLKQCIDIIEENTQIDKIIKSILDLQNLKKLLFNKPQLKLMKYQNRYINIGDPKRTIEYLKNLDNVSDLKYNSALENMNRTDEGTDLKLIQGLKTYYNM